MRSFKNPLFCMHCIGKGIGSLRFVRSVNDFTHYGYFMEGSNDIIRVLGYNLLIRLRVQLYLYSGIKYN